jgi:RimJ/RimL family protein N-acetyltransferase
MSMYPVAVSRAPTTYLENTISALLNLLPLVCNRVILRRLSPDDLAPFQAYRHDEAVGRYQGWLPVSDQDALALLEKMQSTPLFARDEWVQLGIADRETDRLVGDIGIGTSADGTRAEIGFSLAANAQGRGLATEAVRAALKLIFAHTSAASIAGITDARNDASIRLLERLGMQRIETKDALFRGEPCVEYVYEMSRAQYGKMARHIRAAVPADMPAVQKIFAACIGAADWLPESSRLQTDFARVSAGELQYVAAVGNNAHSGDVLGFISVQPQESFVHHLYVHPDFCGHGVGRALLTSLEPWLPTPWRLKCVRANHRALAFYLAFGWREVGTGEFMDGAYSILEWQRREPVARADMKL